MHWVGKWGPEQLGKGNHKATDMCGALEMMMKGKGRVHFKVA